MRNKGGREGTKNAPVVSEYCNVLLSKSSFEAKMEKSNLDGKFMSICYCSLYSSVCLKYWSIEIKGGKKKGQLETDEGSPWMSECEVGLYFLDIGEPLKVLA